MTEDKAGDDPILRELLPGYLSRRREELATLRDALERGDFEKLRTIGHNLHGSGGAYGLVRISQLGKELEVSAAAADGDAIRATIGKMQEFLEEVAV